MAISITLLTNASENAGGDIVTEEIAPAGPVLFWAFVGEALSDTLGPPSGLGLTWEEVGFVTDGTGYRALALWIGRGTPTPGQITLPANANELEWRGWGAGELSGASQTAIVSSNLVTAQGAAGNALTFPQTIADGNGAIGIFAAGSGHLFSSTREGWSPLHTAGPVIPGEMNLCAVWRSDPDTAAGVTWDSGSSFYGLSVELEAAGGDEPPDPTTVAIDQADPQQVEVGSTLQLSATVTNGDGATTWASDDEAVATVDASGLVSGVAVGSAEITATNNGVSDSITVNVEAAPAQAPTVTITSPAGNIAVTEGTTIVATATATDPVDGDLSAEVEWTSSVDGALGTGASIQIVTGGWTEGNRTITATATNAAELDGSASFVLTIGEAPEPPEPVARFDAARFAINAAGGIA